MHIIKHYQEKGLIRKIDSAPPPDQVHSSHSGMHHSLTPPTSNGLALLLAMLPCSEVCRPNLIGHCG